MQQNQDPSSKWYLTPSVSHVNEVISAFPEPQSYHLKQEYHHPVQFSSVVQSCPTLCDPMNRSMPGLPVNHHLPEFTQTHVH